VAGFFQGDEPVRLHAGGLIELGREREADLEHVAFGEPVERTAFPSEPWVSRAVRSGEKSSGEIGASDLTARWESQVRFGPPVRPWFLGARDLKHCLRDCHSENREI
jgi:hypothetical protein